MVVEVVVVAVVVAVEGSVGEQTERNAGEICD